LSRVLQSRHRFTAVSRHLCINNGRHRVVDLLKETGAMAGSPAN
jgi:hypothetical protein